mmetsp:Transcript_13007/g.18988  ORF Transcript_13007/g.18988 Transcript_13007/m.18988 type:complete len:612 (-) Transcript_13007:9-1844(-)
MKMDANKKRKSSIEQKKGRKIKKRKNVPKEENSTKKKKVKGSNVKHEQVSKTKNQKKQLLSLASRLKKQRGTAASTPLPPEWSRASSNTPKYLSPKDGDDFESCVHECYQGFRYEKSNELPPNIHTEFSTSFKEMNDAGLFLYDVVQPGGKKLSRTFVTRTLVGDPGSTYKYLGLRLFSHPWCDVNEHGDGEITGDFGKYKGSLELGKTLKDKLGYSAKCSKSLITIGLINKYLGERTNAILKNEISPSIKNGLVGSADYSLTLINRMEPTMIKKDLKDDKIHGIGKTSVSWHKDSGLQDFSSIAVYHTLQNIQSDNNNSASASEPWKVALRVADNSKTPALSVPLPSGTIYYLLDDFNHQHEHAVISGSTSLRYSSTHRVARDGCGGWQYIRDKCKSTLSNSLCSGFFNREIDEDILKEFSTSSKKKQLVKDFRACLTLMIELEFEWLRQWHIQGHHHADLHRFWHRPFQSLEVSYRKLKEVVLFILETLREATSKTKSNIISEDLFDVAIENVESREKHRITWSLRLRDSIFATLPEEMQPITTSLFDDDDDATALKIRKWRGRYVKSLTLKQDKTGSRNTKINEKTSNLTKKEKKKVASNWEKLKRKI